MGRKKRDGERGNGIKKNELAFLLLVTLFPKRWRIRIGSFAANSSSSRLHFDMNRRGLVLCTATLLFALSWATESLAEAEADAVRSMMLRHPRPDSSRTSTFSRTSLCFATPYRGLFVQEEPDARRGERGNLSLLQHPDFGARVPWSFILDLADGKLGGGGRGGGGREKANDDNNDETSSPCQNCFLVYAIRHGRAISNAVRQFVGDDAWNSGIGQACDFVGDVPELRGESRRKEENASWPLFDAPLSDKGREQANSLGELLNAGGWAKRLIGENGDSDDDVDDGSESENSKENAVVVVASPLSRTLDTALLALGPAFLNSSVRFHVSEWARETTGVNTCDARRGVSGGGSPSLAENGGGGGFGEEEQGRQRRHRRCRHRLCSCSYDKGLRELYSSSSSSPSSSTFDGFPVVGRGKEPWSPEKEEGAPSSLSASSSLSSLSASSSSLSSPPPLLGLFSKNDELWDPETRESAESVRKRTQVFLELATELGGRGRGRGGVDGDKGGEKSGGGGGSGRRISSQGEEKKRRQSHRHRHRPHRRIFVVAHSGWIEQLLIGVGRRGFVPENAELVPLLVQRREGAECGAAAAGGILEEG